ncbi:hypothetical protein BU17DRAFT_89780 [Hysterangium stoloniferum]|nr:hypothetical protein BU17DRAFT_89780 [Hysterangium stoloniferum]
MDIEPISLTSFSTTSPSLSTGSTFSESQASSFGTSSSVGRLTTHSHQNEDSDEIHYPLEDFFKRFTLEPMSYGPRAPDFPHGRSIMMPLRMSPGGYRTLREMSRIPRLEAEMSYFFNESKATLGLEKELEDLQLSVQLPPEQLQAMMGFDPYLVEERSAVIFALERGPIQSAVKLAAVFDKELVDWRFVTPPRIHELNRQGIQSKYYCTLDENGKMENVRCILIPLTTWEFSGTDFEEFSNKTQASISAFVNGRNLNPPWVNADLMWAFVHDLCFSYECHHFVITSYEDWVFGSFTDYYTRGYVSPVIMCTAQPKSPLEYLTYWILSSYGAFDTALVDQDRPKASVIRHLFAKPTAPAKRGAEIVGEDSGLIQPVAKRLRRDPFEVRLGWVPLEGHHSEKYSSASPKISKKTKPRRHYKRPYPKNKILSEFPTVRPLWNKFMSKRKRLTVELSHNDKKSSDMEKRRLTPNENNMFKFSLIPTFDYEMDLTQSRYHSEAYSPVEDSILPSFGATSSFQTAHNSGLQYDLSQMEVEWGQPKITTMICQSFDPSLEEEQCDADIGPTSVTMHVEATRDAHPMEGRQISTTSSVPAL